MLDCENLRRFKSLGRNTTIRAGDTLFREGDPATTVFTLTRGSLKLYKLLPDGRRQVVGFLGAGDFLGISIEGEHAFTAEMLEDAELCAFPLRRFDGFVDEHPDMERELYRMAAHELAIAQLQLVLVGRKTALERLASFLLFLVERAERVTGGKIDVIALPMNRADIADYLGLTKETVSRLFSTLRAERLIRLRQLDEVEIIDSPALRRLADCGA